MLESLKPISPGWWWVRTCCCARAVPTSVKVGRAHLSIELWGEFVFFFLCVFLILLPVKIESFSAYVMFMYELVSCLLTRVQKRKRRFFHSAILILFFFPSVQQQLREARPLMIRVMVIQTADCSKRRYLCCHTQTSRHPHVALAAAATRFQEKSVSFFLLTYSEISDDVTGGVILSRSRTSSSSSERVYSRTTHTHIGAIRTARCLFDCRAQ